MRSIALAIVGLVLTALSHVGATQNFAPERMPSHSVSPMPGLNVDQAAAIARSRTGGRVLDVKPIGGGNQSSYAVRLLLDAGRVRTVVIDGDSGQLR